MRGTNIMNKFMRSRKVKSFVIIGMILCMVLTGICSMTSLAAERVKIACVGDSNTYGKGVSNKGVDSYPAQLQSMLGDMYEVKNFGLSNASVETGSTLCYTESDKYIDAVEYNADKYILMFGTNDAKLVNYKGKDKFKSDYKNMIEKFGKDKVILMEIAPVNYSKDVVFDKEWTTPEMVDEINGLIREIAAEEGVKLVRNYDELNKIKPVVIVEDGVHMNKTGLAMVANNVYEELV